MEDDAGQGHGRPRATRDYNAKAARAKLMSRDTATRCSGARTSPATSSRMATTRWRATPATRRGRRAARGCHLPIEANWKTERHHYEGGETRNFATYNPQVARDDMFQLGRHGPIKGSKIAPVRSSLGAGAVVDQHQPRADLRPAAADRGVRLQLAGVRAALPAHRAQDRDQDLHATATCRRTTTTTRSWRSCCCSGPTSSISSASTPGSASDGGVERGAGHRVGRAAGRDRQLSAPLRLSGLVRSSIRRAKRRAQSAARATSHERAATRSCLQLRGEYMYVAEGSGRLARLRRRQHRATRACRRRSSPRRSRRWGRTRTSPSTERDLRRAADQPADRADAQRRAT